MQETDDKGQVSFTTIFPACYDGRWPHIHFEVYPSLAKATNSANKIATSQMALTEEASKAVYATTGYEASVKNLSQVSLDSDNVFSDGYDLQIPTITGNASAGYNLTFKVRGVIEVVALVDASRTAPVVPESSTSLSGDDDPVAKLIIDHGEAVLGPVGQQDQLTVRPGAAGRAGRSSGGVEEPPQQPIRMSASIMKTPWPVYSSPPSRTRR